MSDMGPSHIINIKKEKRETDEETKQILRMLEKDDVGPRSLGNGFFVAAKEGFQGARPGRLQAFGHRSTKAGLGMQLSGESACPCV